MFAGILITQTALLSAQPNLPIAEKTTSTEISGIRIYDPLPKDFDYLHASTTNLARYGLPERPDKQSSPDAFQVWNKLVQRAKSRVRAKFSLTNLYNTPPPSDRKDLLAAASSPIWSGFAIDDPNKPFAAAYSVVVSGSFRVPEVTSGCEAGAPSSTYYSSEWVGVDGFGGTDVLQTGVLVQVICPPNGGVVIFPWVEWFPAPAIEVDFPFPFRSGDVVEFNVWVLNLNGVPHYTLSLHNTNDNFGGAVDFQPSPPSPSKVVGNTIEWIVERPTVNGSTTLLAPYGQMIWGTIGGYVQASANTKPILYRPSNAPTGESYSISMCQNNQTVSSATLLRHGHPIDRAIFKSTTPYKSKNVETLTCLAQKTPDRASAEQQNEK
jgi:hypothetical protein